MMKFDRQSSIDLEFNVVCELLATYCKSQKAKENALKIDFFNDRTTLTNEFDLLDEIKYIYDDARLKFPHPNAEDIDTALNILRIENGGTYLATIASDLFTLLGNQTINRFCEKPKK